MRSAISFIVSVLIVFATLLLYFVLMETNRKEAFILMATAASAAVVSLAAIVSLIWWAVRRFNEHRFGEVFAVLLVTTCVLVYFELIHIHL